jgi:CheY-like chemotaxis protein
MSTGGGGTRVHVLYAEDSAFLRALVAERLGAAGFTVTVAADGAEAWQAWTGAGGAFDVVVTDLEMPGCGGLELVRRIRAAGDEATPVIALTSLGGPEVLDRCLEAGVTRFLVKFDFAEVTRTIRELAGGRR